MSRLLLFMALGFFCATALVGGRALAQSQGSVLFVAPHRLVIEDGERVDIINVSNKSEESRRYDLTIVDQVMGPEGVTQRKDTFEYSAKGMVKFVPKRFTLKPGERQTVRVMVTRPENLADGDYHSHLLFREVPLTVKDKQDQQNAPKTDEKKVTFEIRTLYGIAVPLIVQKGKMVADVSMGAPQVGKTQDGKLHKLTIPFTRSGNSEAAGKVSAEYVQEGRTPVPVVDGQWVRLYREVETISKDFVLSNMPADAKGGKIVVHLMKDENDTTKTETREIPF